MIKKHLLIVLLSFLFIPSIFAQNKKDSLVMQFHFKFQDTPLVLNKKYLSQNQDTLQISLLKLYITNIEIQFEDQSVFQQPNSVHLLDIEDLSSLRLPLSKNENKSIAKVSFQIGIDSTTSTSGALSGDLDPTKGMYWAWQSGYINMKIEGTSASCKTRKNQFQFHIGGYKQPFYAMRKVVVAPHHNNLDIAIDVAAFFSELQLATTNAVMIPGKQSITLADTSVKMFRVE